jgi:imidazolonepropionase-like amidohydrolase
MIFAGTSLHDELDELVTAGLTPTESLATATRNAAAFLGRNDVGRIAPGQLADFVLLRSDPLEKIGNSHSVDGVVLRGRLLERANLDALLNPPH